MRPQPENDWAYHLCLCAAFTARHPQIIGQFRIGLLFKCEIRSGFGTRWGLLVPDDGLVLDCTNVNFKLTASEVCQCLSLRQYIMC